MHFRFRYRIEGGHVHVRVFSGRDRHMTHGKNGDLVFALDEWPAFLGQCASVEVVHEDDPLPSRRDPPE